MIKNILNYDLLVLFTQYYVELYYKVLLINSVHLLSFKFDKFSIGIKNCKQGKGFIEEILK